eukprot:Tbor_TRINITY_DN5363_c0_g1::TRINITY_DN5363_c0_g1_i1::g.4804::m.4804/K01530/E3.6.3.1; phospholipid-translocating ATPase
MSSNSFHLTIEKINGVIYSNDEHQQSSLAKLVKSNRDTRDPIFSDEDKSPSNLSMVSSTKFNDTKLVIRNTAGEQRNVIKDSPASSVLEIVMGDHVINHQRYGFSSNYIKTSKYTIFSFLPLNLYYQFRKIANLLFLAQLVIIFIPGATPFDPLSVLIPVVTLIGLGMIKEGYEDYKRYRADVQANSAKVRVLRKKGDIKSLSDNFINRVKTLLCCRRQGHYQVQESLAEIVPRTIANNVALIEVQSRDIRVGDIVLLSNKELLCADILLLSSSGDEGQAFVETSNLDGETSIKQKASVFGSAPPLLATEKSLIQSMGEVAGHMIKSSGGVFPPVLVKTLVPNSCLYEWSGVVDVNILKDVVEMAHQGGKSHFENIEAMTSGEHAVGIDNLLLRSSQLRNTEWAWGVVLYTGTDTKMYRNLKQRPIKLGHMDRKLNHLVIVLFIFMMALTIILAILSIVFTRSEGSKHWYLNYYILDFAKDNVDLYFPFLVFYGLMAYIVSLALFVTMEFLKLFQEFFIVMDAGLMKYVPPPIGDDDEINENLPSSVSLKERERKNRKDPKNWKRCAVNTSNLNEDLGIISHIFTDKTGTLTENVMEFREGNVLGEMIIVPDTKIDEFDDETNKNSVPEQNHDDDDNEDRKAKLHVFHEALTLCHTVQSIVSRRSNTPDLTGKKNVGDEIEMSASDKKTRRGRRNDVTFEGQSPDEIALVTYASYCGYKFLNRTSKYLEISPGNNKKSVKYELKALLPFTVTRKMMSVVIRDPVSGRLRLISKGADSSMLVRLSNESATNAQHIAHTKEDLNRMASKGLRTLVIGQREVSEEEFATWLLRFRRAGKTLGDSRCVKIDQVCQELEKDIELIGITGIEDHLQEHVPETLQFFISAGVKVWMLTGDKMETAITIAATSSLVNPEIDTIRYINGQLKNDPLSITSKSIFGEQLDEICGLAERIISERDTETSMVKRQKDVEDGFHNVEPVHLTKRSVMVLDGPALNACFEPENYDKFMKASLLVDVAVCCRLTPLQKAEVVRIYQEGSGKAALAIGDGSNDVSMIQEATMGIGILGQEGAQAERAADFAIPRFHHLIRLCAVHGRYSIRRNSITVLTSVYKNIVLSIGIFLYSFYCGFSGSSIFEGWFLSFFNVIFTSLPPIGMGVFEKDYPEEELMKRPILYRALSKDNLYFSVKDIVRYIVESTVAGVLVFYLSYNMLEEGDIGGEGRLVDGQMIGSVQILALLLMTWTKMGLSVKYWTVPMASVFVLSVLITLVFLFVFSSLSLNGTDTTFYNTIFIIGVSSKFWFFMLLINLGLVVMPFATCTVFQKQYFPNSRDLAEVEDSREYRSYIRNVYKK